VPESRISASGNTLQRALDLEPGSEVGKYYLSWAQFGLDRLMEAQRTAEQALLRDAKPVAVLFPARQNSHPSTQSPAALKDWNRT